MNATKKAAPKTTAKAAAPAHKLVAKKAPAKVAAKAPGKKAAAVKAPVKTPVKAVTPAPVAKPAATPKPAKIKLVRDSFTMPSDEYAVLGELKQRALKSAHPVKKSELLRAGVKLLAGLGDTALMRALSNVPTIKTGRPKSKKGD
ncbi:MAG TPA: hypothetical protein VGM81_01565 [Burkholderiaceae bacterium]|jgi:hypothetical protein